MPISPENPSSAACRKMNSCGRNFASGFPPFRIFNMLELKVPAAVKVPMALGSKDVKFAELSLVIIDEEQHFGAAEKGKLSSLSKGLYALWMTATPIPRTLAAGLAGFRDISVIATPPATPAADRDQSCFAV